ncbi:S9 family peptidase [Microbacterium sp. JZ37]|uniref:S9 family peptidase n=1 Tax=Microbacterium sp. JZ37 TaxID=2654193 RepID=UPI002B497A8B|nr:S9 family peptidase [Microbacterium sp. JZ37]WRH18021.1 prolyl oligopeptidase family serine peptidase [Microbacterium sp. JZ37]
MTPDAQTAPPIAPTAPRRPVVRTHHGDVVEDGYEWLRAKDDAEVRAHLEAENAYTDARLAHLEPLRETIFQEIKGRVRETDLTVPVRQGGWWYYGRSLEGRQYGLQCRAPLASEDDWTPPKLDVDVEVPGEQVLLDGNVEAEGHEYFALGAFSVTTDGSRMLWGVDTQGDERYTVRVKDIATGELLPDVLEGLGGGARFTPDGRFILYSTVDDAWRPDGVWLHRVGEPTREHDVEIAHEDDDAFWIGAGFTRSRQYLVIESASNTTSEIQVLPVADLPRLAEDPAAVPRTTIWSRSERIEYSVDHAVVDDADWLYVLHNRGALDFELVRVPADAPDAEPELVIPHSPGTRLESVDCLRDFAIVEYRSGGIPRVGILDYRTHAVREIAFDEPLYNAGSGGNPEWAQPVVRLSYGSFTTPGTVFDYVVETGELRELKHVEVLGGYDPADYGQERLWAPAADGTLIPVSVVWKRSFGDPGAAPRPLHLYGYGSYEHSIDPGFSYARLSELDRGVVFAVAHVRGGGEMGRAWYEDGKLANKRNSFTDFVDVARFLVDGGYTSPDRMVAEGGSAGGLLMGAVANLAPELFAGILADVPFVDALTTILDPSLPLTVIEWEEWGDPLHDPEVYAYMKSYTPYENVREGVRYPRILAMTSLNDTRVLYVEPAKWVARLREVDADALLRCEMTAGHGGVSGRYNAWRERAFQLAWMFDVLGIADEASDRLA